MNVTVDDISEQEFTVDIILKKEDYFDEFKKNLSLYKNNVKRKGFRNNNNTPVEVIYREYGLSALEMVCDKLINEELNKITSDKKFENKILYHPIVIESTFPENKLTLDFHNVEELKFKYIYGFVDKIDIDEFSKKIKNENVEVEELVCNKIDDDICKKMSNQFKFTYFINEDKKISDNDSVLFLEDDKKIQISFPAKGVKIDDKELDLINKKIGDIIEINVEDENSLKIENEVINTVLEYKLKKGLNKFKVVHVAEYKEKEIKNELLNKYLLTKFDLDKENDKWLIENLDLDKITNNNFKDNDIDKDYDEKIKNLTCNYANYFLNKLNRGKIREKILENISLDLPKTYLKEKAKTIAKVNNDDILDKYVEILTTYYILDNFMSSLIKKFDIKCTDDDVKKYITLKKYMESNQETTLIDNAFTSKLKLGTYDKDNNPTENVLDLKAIFKIKEIFKINIKNVTYKEYLDLLK